MFRFFISFSIISLFGLFTGLYGQASGNAERDSIRKSEEYGLRVGVDLSRPLIGVLNEDYSGTNSTWLLNWVMNPELQTKYLTMKMI